MMTPRSIVATMAATVMVVTMSTVASADKVLSRENYLRRDRQLNIGKFPTPAPTEADPTPAPTNPDIFVCEICGEGLSVTIPDGIVDIPTQGEFTCSALEQSASMGLIAPGQCALLTSFVTEPCGCEGSGPSPTDEPAPEPTDEPAPEPTDEPAPEPTDEPAPEPTDEPAPEPTDEPAPEPTDEPAPEPTDEPVGCQTIAEIACGTDDFSTLCEAVVAAGLDEALSDPEASLTVFAPNNAAFEAIADVLPTLTPEQVEFVLLYHVVDGVVLSDDLVCEADVTMLNGLNTTTECVNGDGIFQVGGGNSALNAPRIISTDIEACNGVIHVVDNVILPPSPPEETEDIIVNVDITFDGFAPETGWSITDTAGEVIIDVPIGSYSPFTESVSEPVVLQTSTSYIFTIVDQFGDGMSNPTDGTYQVATEEGEVLASGGGNFGFDESTTFTTPSP